MNLSGKKIAILGCGRSGIAAARLARSKGAAEVCIFDSNPAASCPDASLPCVPNATEDNARRYAADLVVISPGIEADTPWTLSFACAGAPIIGEIELGYAFYPGRIIAVTGTNGKTTTTALIEHILTSVGKTAKACGNYGFPFCELAMTEPAPEFAVLEVSSFQMETIRDFKPETAIWLNFAPDHMDRYKKVEDYYNAKRRIFENMDASQYAIVRVGERLPDLKPSRLEFSSAENTGRLRYSHGFVREKNRKIVDLQGTAMEQAHNAENAMAAILACRVVGLHDSDIAEAIRSFTPPAHRCEIVADTGGVLWLNDSKSTNLHSTEAAVRSQARPVILLAGGKDKGLDYSPIIPLLERKARLCIVFGQIADQLESTFSPVVTTIKVHTVEEAVKEATWQVQRGDVVLFSPGTSSFDQFSSYAQRGECYRNAVRKLLHV